MKIVFLLTLGIHFDEVLAQKKTLLYKGRTRRYIVHIPVSYSPDKSHALLFSLHSFGSGARLQRIYTKFDRIADTAGFIVVYPDGIRHTWNSELKKSRPDDLGFISALIDTLAAHYNIDLCRVYSTGMSKGGFMSHRLAADLGHRIAAIASVTGTLTYNVMKGGKFSSVVPVLQIHGTADFIVPYRSTAYYPSVDSIIKFWANKNGCSPMPAVSFLPNIKKEGSTITKYCYGTKADPCLVVLFKVKNGGHTWPGARGVPFLGITNRDINAGAEIWKFLRKYKLDTCK